jgi:hypothetical protein
MPGAAAWRRRGLTTLTRSVLPAQSGGATRTRNHRPWQARAHVRGAGRGLLAAQIRSQRANEVASEACQWAFTTGTCGGR